MPVSQTVGAPVPDEAVLGFIEGELKNSGHLDGISTMAYLMKVGRVNPQQKAGLRLALAMYGERVDPSAHALIRDALRAAEA
jgi:hypothetical protein